MTSQSSTSQRLKPDTLAVSVTILLLANIVQRTIGFGRGILFCRWLSPDELGTWEMAYSFLLLAAPVVVLGLPGCFGRYLERFRQRGQLRTFLRRATIWTAGLTAAAFALMVATAPLFSTLIFGSADDTTLVVILALSLVAVILHHYLEAVFAALRKYTIVSTMHFCQSLSFAVISLTLLWFWRFSAVSIVIGYGMACLVSAVGILLLKGRAVAEEAVHVEPIAHREFWPPLLRFAFWVWVINLFCHLFGIVDRYMLVHCSGLDSTAALALVGQYHASRIIPVLFLSVADLLAGAVMPYLSHDWELGARERVSERLNFVLKVTSFAMLAGAVVVLWCSPILFQLAFGGRYDEGLRVMPMTITYCIWYSLLLVGQNYVWCAEKTRLGVVPVVAGLLLNIAINLMLVPAWGLAGAVASTNIATAFALVLMYWLNHRAGMRLAPGMLVLSIAPLALCGGVWCGTAVLLLLTVLMPFSKYLITLDERVMIAAFVQPYIQRLASYWSPTAEEGEVTHAV